MTTARATPEWVGATPDTPVPNRVWLRVLEKHNWLCASCKKPQKLVKIFHRDHKIALVNWTEPPPHGNREANLQPLCEACHAKKTPLDVADKARAARHKEMRQGFVRRKDRVGFKSPTEGTYKFNWKRGRYERVD